VALSRNRKFRSSFSAKQGYSNTFRQNTGTYVKKKGANRNVLKVLMFWLLFFVFISCLFLINRERIRTTIENAHFPLWFSKKIQTEQLKVPVPEEEVPVQAEEVHGFIGKSAESDPFLPEEDRPEISESGDGQDRVPRSFQERREAVSAEPVNSPVLSASPQTSMTLAPAQPSPDTAVRTRFLYFIQLDAEGTILRSKVSRSLPGSDSPLGDVLEALLAGPSQEEQDQGLISLIPGGTKLLSVIIRLETAYINLSEDFLYTPYGSEGYTAQLQQLIWTITEFPTIRDVQLLIEGRKLDYLGDITWIGSPLGRDSF
jgi:spore germination protein GerM/preprotein translocase subunit SecG